MTSPDLTWTDNATNEAGFLIERCTDAGCTNFAQIAAPGPFAGTGTASYTDATVVVGNVYQYRVAAVNATGEIGGEKALGLLYGCLDKKSIREMTMHVLERVGTQDSIKYLAMCLSSDELREIAVKAIITIAERERCRPRPEYFISLAYTLKEMYLSADPDKKKQAFLALCWLEDILSVPYLIEGLRDDDLMEYAIEGLLHLGKKAVCSIVDSLKQSAGPHRAALAKILNMLDENLALLQFAEDDDPEVRTEVALVLGSIPLEDNLGAAELELAPPEIELLNNLSAIEEGYPYRLLRLYSTRS